MLQTRRQFLRRSTLAAAAAVALPSWARWLSEQMEKLQPTPKVRVFLSRSEPQSGELRFVLREWEETSSYSTIFVPQYANGRVSGFGEMKIYSDVVAGKRKAVS